MNIKIYYWISKYRLCIKKKGAVRNCQQRETREYPLCVFATIPRVSNKEVSVASSIPRAAPPALS